MQVERKQKKNLRDMLNKIFDFLKNNYKTILKVFLGLFLLYWVVFVLTPKVSMSQIDRAKIDSINLQLKQLHQDNLKLESEIDLYNQQIQEIDNNIQNIKGQKTIIKEFYHEKISGVDRLTIAELDSFFANRYK